MNIYRYEAAFGRGDITSRAMRNAFSDWQAVYYGTGDGDPSQRIGYTVVNKIISAMFGEYQLTADPQIAPLDRKRREVMQQLLISGGCFLKPYPTAGGFDFTIVPRTNVLIFARDGEGHPTDIGMAEQSIRGKHYYTLLERRYIGDGGLVTIENRLYRA